MINNMSTVQFPYRNEPQNQYWSSRDRRQTRHKVPQSSESKQVIDYGKLRWLCSQSGDSRFVSSDQDHSFFMNNYHQMFVNSNATPKILTGRADACSLVSATNKSTGFLSPLPKNNGKDLKSVEMSHEIKDHLALLHKERKIADPEVIKTNRIKDLRRILKKLPFERSSEDNRTVFKHLKAFPLLANQTTTEELKEISAVVTLDVWRDEDYTVFGNSGFYIILKGSVLSQTDPWIHLKSKNENKPARNVTRFLLEKNLPELGVGDCFGCLERIEGQEVNSQVLTVKTKTLPCEFLKVSSNDYKRIAQQLKEKDLMEKCSLVQPCEAYKLWPRQSLLKLAELIEWASFPENTVLVTEGFLCPFIGFIKSGECHVLRQVEVNHKFRNGKEEKRVKQVVMGKLMTSQSFGEISVLEEDAITCSIVTATDVILGIITPDRITDLDETTQSLLLQTNERTFGNLSQDEIYVEYIEQEMKKEWNQFKHRVVVDVINGTGIRPGCGKWSKSVTQ